MITKNIVAVVFAVVNGHFTSNMIVNSLFFLIAGGG